MERRSGKGVFEEVKGSGAGESEVGRKEGEGEKKRE